MKKIIYILSILFTFCFSYKANGQNIEILVLTSGIEIYGTIERLENGGVKIVDTNGDTFIFSESEILRITNEKEKKKEIKEERAKQENYAKYNKRGRTIYKKIRGYSGIIEGNLGYHAPSSNFSIGTIQGYRFSPYIFTGLGSNILIDDYFNQYNGYTETRIFIPIYAHLRYSIIGRPVKASPFISLSTGALIGEESSFLIESSFGVEIRSIKKGSLWIGLKLSADGVHTAPLGVLLSFGWSY